MKIMVVDDYDDIRTMVKMMLEAGGHEVVEAADGREAVLYATGDGPDLILMDLNLPVLDGYGIPGFNLGQKRAEFSSRRGRGGQDTGRRVRPMRLFMPHYGVRPNASVFYTLLRS